MPLQSQTKEVRLWIDAVTRCGSTISRASWQAHDVFIRAAIAGGWRSQISRLNTFGANDLTGAMYPIIHDKGNAVDTNNGFAGGDFTLSGGLNPVSGTKYLQTGYLANDASVSSNVHFGMCNLGTFYAPGSGTNWSQIGANDNTNLSFASAAASNASNGTQTPNECALGYAGSLNSTTAVNQVSSGFWICTATDSTHCAIYRNGGASISLSPTYVQTVSVPALEFYVFAQNKANAAFKVTSFQMGGYSIGGGMTLAQATAYYTAMATLQAALGRTIPS